MLRKHFFILYINDMAIFNQTKLFYLIKFTLGSVKVLSSPSSAILFAIVFWIEANRGNLPQMFFKVDAFKNFEKFYRKSPVSESLSGKVAGLKETPAQLFLCKICKIFSKHRKYLWFVAWRRDFLVILHTSTLVFQYMLNWLTKSCFDISLLFKLKCAAILVLRYTVDCE